jgi:hypothetical protein
LAETEAAISQGAPRAAGRPPDNPGAG